MRTRTGGRGSVFKAVVQVVYNQPYVPIYIYLRIQTTTIHSQNVCFSVKFVLCHAFPLTWLAFPLPQRRGRKR